MDDQAEVYCMGGVARRVLSSESRAAVRGASSRGLFLGLDSGWVVFLSPEQFRGPLTMNLRGEAGLLRDLDQGKEVLLGEEGLEFTPAGPFIRTREAETWFAPDPPARILPVAVAGPRLEAVARRLLAGAGETEQACLLALLLEDPQAGCTSEGGGRVGLGALALRQALHSGQPGEILRAVKAVLGAGPGLTPLGDDILAGLMLSITRYPHAMPARKHLAGLEAEIVKRAYRLTTTLSANLIECASLGQADERLTGALDGLLSGALDPDRIAAALAGWGSSSGAGVLAGMWLAFGDAPSSTA